MFTKYDIYKEMKNKMLAYIKYLLIVSMCFIGVGLGYFACMMANLLNTTQKLPLNVQMAVPDKYL